MCALIRDTVEHEWIPYSDFAVIDISAADGSQPTMVPYRGGFHGLLSPRF